MTYTEHPHPADHAADPAAVAVAVAFDPRTEVLRRWQADWDRWAHSDHAHDGLRRWTADPTLTPHVGSIAVLLAACGRDRQVPNATADARLHALIIHARGGDHAAGRVVLERVMPALTGRAARWATRSSLPFRHAVEELVASAWLVIAAYPVDRRPVKIAANVVRDAEYQLYGYTPMIHRRTCSYPDPPEQAARLDGRPADPSHPGGELFDLIADGLAGGIPAPMLRTVAALAAGFSPGEIAAEAGITVRGVWRRRDREARALAATVAAGNPTTDRATAARATEQAGGRR
ncbi:hypothetical protein [Frankia sp. Cas4]|uniref:hypothetical protein n=1 Tax=Frankia sp. Cas4 TaxID=3073927 RepID=UPI002AD3EE42|nr:hypothetical protein [Frankia sp. Cas4]